MMSRSPRQAHAYSEVFHNIENCGQKTPSTVVHNALGWLVRPLECSVKHEKLKLNTNKDRARYA